MSSDFILKGRKRSAALPNFLDFGNRIPKVCSVILKEYRMVFRAGLRDPWTRDIARLSESVSGTNDFDTKENATVR